MMLPHELDWYKDAVIYEVHVRAYCDSTGEGTGDFRGLTQKLDYLQDLGVTAIWLLPFYPSPLRDDGYDIADYTTIHPDYGTLDAFQEFLKAAHSRGLRVITELVINHTSDQHPWFQRARRAASGSPERDYYVWSDTPEKYAQARIIFKDFETSNWAWDKVAKAYYWHRFYSHQPDLNFDNPAVWNAIFPVLDFWLEMGVDGLRLDAVPYLYEREGTNCENLPETHGFLKALRKRVDEKFPGRMLLAEANQWPEDSVAYFGQGDECHMAFHFPVMPRLFMAMHTEDRLPIVDIMNQTPTIPDSSQWALFLRNHDELTLEMVTDEERDSMYRAYAADPRARINLGIRHRLAPLLRNNRRRIELMNGLLFSLPGTPVLYYGDEIGMGDNIYLGDRNGVRTPMQWSADRNAGFSRANPQKLYLPIIIDPEYHYEAVNVEAQQNNPSSLLWWTKRLIGLRRMHRAFSRGSLKFLRPLNRRVLAFLRQTEDESLLVVANLSRFSQCAELDLSEFEGSTPVELFGATPFPPIGSQPYQVMLGPHTFYWFSLTPAKQGAFASGGWGDLPSVDLGVPWDRLPPGAEFGSLEPALAAYLERTASVSQQHRGSIQRITVVDSMPFPCREYRAQLLLIETERAGGEPAHSWLAVAVLGPEEAAQAVAGDVDGRICHLKGDSVGILCDASQLPSFHAELVTFLRDGRRVLGADRSVSGVRTEGEWPNSDAPLESLPVRRPPSDGNGTSWIFGEQFVLKLLSHVEAIPHPEKELGRWLTETKHFSQASRWLGSLEFRRRRDQPMLLAALHEYVPNEGTAWQLTLDELSLYFDRVLTLPENSLHPPRVTVEAVKSPQFVLPGPVMETCAGYLELVPLLAQRLAELHLTTSGEVEDSHFAPEEFSLQYQRSLYQSLRNLSSKALHELRQAEATLPDEMRIQAARVLSREQEIYGRFQKMMDSQIQTWRIRIHGDCHLGQILRSGSDFIFIDFEGNPLAAGIRRIKRSPLHDVVGMLHSFEFAAEVAHQGVSHRRGGSVGVVRPEDYSMLSEWKVFWRTLVQQLFVDRYRAATAERRPLQMADRDLNRMVDSLGLSKALAEVRTQLVENVSAVGAALAIVERWLDEPWSGRDVDGGGL